MAGLVQPASGRVFCFAAAEARVFDEEEEISSEGVPTQTHHGGTVSERERGRGFKLCGLGAERGGRKEGRKGSEYNENVSDEREREGGGASWPGRGGRRTFLLAH